jgi:hypothetical protein
MSQCPTPDCRKPTFQHMDPKYNRDVPCSGNTEYLGFSLRNAALARHNHWTSPRLLASAGTFACSQRRNLKTWTRHVTSATMRRDNFATIRLYLKQMNIKVAEVHIIGIKELGRYRARPRVCKPLHLGCLFLACFPFLKDKSRLTRSPSCLYALPFQLWTSWRCHERTTDVTP